MPSAFAMAASTRGSVEAARSVNRIVDTDATPAISANISRPPSPSPDARRIRIWPYPAFFANHWNAWLSQSPPPSSISACDGAARRGFAGSPVTKKRAPATAAGCCVPRGSAIAGTADAVPAHINAMPNTPCRKATLPSKQQIARSMCYFYIPI